MTVAVFNKGQFVDFWLNDLDEKTWINRTISAKGWLIQDVEVYAYQYSRANNEILTFDSEKNLQKIRIDEVQVDDGEGNTSTVNTVVVEQTYNKIPIYLNGSMVS